MATTVQPLVSTLQTTTVLANERPPKNEALKNKLSSDNTLNAIPEEKLQKDKPKDVEMYSGIPNLLIKLNRTSRKQLQSAQLNKEELPTTTTKLELAEDQKSTNEDILIDPKLEDLNSNFSENNESEIFIITPSKIVAERMQKESNSAKESFETSTAHEESVESIPLPQPKPNRKRQLTRPQYRSFYPYFFSRVLG